MKLSLEQPLFDYNGQASSMPDGTIASLRKVLIAALLADSTPDNRPLSPTDKVERFTLFSKVANAADDTDFTVEEVAKFKDAVLVFPTYTAGTLRKILDS
jgi:hypothetical protein